MTRATGKALMSELAQIERQLAELTARRARVFQAIAEGETVDLTTGKRLAARHKPAIPAVTELDRARARRELQKSDRRRSFGR